MFKHIAGAFRRTVGLRQPARSPGRHSYAHVAARAQTGARSREQRRTLYQVVRGVDLSDIFNGAAYRGTGSDHGEQDMTILVRPYVLVHVDGACGG